VFLKNPRKAFTKFQSEHFLKKVGWDGYVVRVNMNDRDPMSMAYHSADIMVQMEEVDMPGGHGADLGVTLSPANLERYSETIDSLHIGDHIAFNATIVSLGDRHHLHHVRAFQIEKVEGHREVQAHAHTTGRYKLALHHNITDQIDVKHS